MTMPTRSPADDGSSFSPPADYSPSSGVRPPATWPSVIGIISIVLGGLGILCWGCNSGGNILSIAAPGIFQGSAVVTVETTSEGDEASSESNTPGESAESSAAAGEEPQESGVTTGSSSQSVQVTPTAGDVIVELLSLVLSIWLLVGGIKLLRRRSEAVATLKAWAWVRILVAVAWVLVYYTNRDNLLMVIQQEMERQAASAGTEPTKINEDIAGMVVLVAIIVIGIVQLIWPVILLIFLNRDSVRQEVETWRDTDRVISGQVGP